MLKYFFRISIKHIKRNRLASVINIAGLALGISSCMVIFLFVKYHLGFDSFHSKYERIFRVYQTEYSANDEDTYAGTPYPMAGAIRSDLPEVEAATYVHYQEEQPVKIGEQKFKERDILFVEADYFKIFDTDWLTVDVSESFSEPNKVVLTEQLAQKYFGSEDPIGKSIEFAGTFDLEVVGVVRALPERSHLKYNMLISEPTMNKDFIGFNYKNWRVSLTSMETFILLPEGQSTEFIEKKIADMLPNHLDEERVDDQDFFIQPLKLVHFSTNLSSIRDDHQISKKYIWIFSVVGFIILILACINFVNLSIAKLIGWRKEVGILRSLSARKKQIVSQFLIETTILTFIAILLSVIILSFLAPKLDELLGEYFTVNIFSEPGLLIFLVICCLIVVLFGGLYPAIYIANQKIVESLQNTSSSQMGGKNVLRNGLVIFQFTVSIALIASTIGVTKQMLYLKNKDLGFDQEHVISVPLSDNDEKYLRLLSDKLDEHPGIIDYTYCFGAPLTDGNLNTSFRLTDAAPDEPLMTSIKPVDSKFGDIYGLDLLAGVWLQESSEEDTIHQFVVNEKVIETLGISDPQDAIGKMLMVSNNYGEITGVVNNFHSQTMHQDIEPIVFFNIPIFVNSVDIKVHPAQTKDVLAFVEESWTEIYPDDFYEYNFVDTQIADLYASEERTSNLVNAFSIIAILIACLGLFGIVSYVLTQRRKEIGVRKVNGAKALDIVVMLNRSFLRWVSLAFIIAVPVSWYVLNRWFENFVFRTSINWWIFALAGLAAVLVAAITVGIQSWQFGRRNPIEDLRYE